MVRSARSVASRMLVVGAKQEEVDRAGGQTHDVIRDAKQQLLKYKGRTFVRLD